MAKPDLPNRLGLGLMLLAVFLAPLIGGYPAGRESGQDAVLGALRSLVILGALIYAATRSQETKPSKTAPSAGGIPYAALAGWVLFGLTLLSVLVHSHFFTSPVLLFAQIPAMLDILCAVLLLHVCADAVRRDPHLRQPIVLIVIAAVAVSALIAARGYGQDVQGGVPENRQQGLFFDANFLAGCLALGLPLLFAACLGARDRLAALGFGALAALTVGALASTGSRAGCAAGVAGLLVTGVCALLARRRAPFPRLAILSGAAIVLLFAFHRPLTARVGAGGPDQGHSAAFRKLTWIGTLDMAKANPILGAGPGVFTYLYPRYAIVERSGLAHESYLQMAAEEGAPAVIAVALVAIFSLGSALIGFRSSDGPKREAGATADTPQFIDRYWLDAAICGACAVGFLRSFFDSEWSILGNLLPFWALVGLTARACMANRPPRWLQPVACILLAIALSLSLLCTRNAALRDAAMQIAISGSRPDIPSVWPPDPDFLRLSGDTDGAAAIEPSGARYFQAARAAEARGDLPGAISRMQEAARLDPTGLQIWRTLAEMQAHAGDTADSLASWRKLIKTYEGVAGKVVAIPELPETHPAFAYAAVGDDAAAHGRVDEARSDYEKAAAVIEGYAHTPSLYQQVEVARAATQHTDLAARREEVKDLYNRVTDSLAALPGTTTDARAQIAQRRAETLDRLAKFAPIPTAP